jgi:radical SAM protein (TIGR01212 family)
VLSAINRGHTAAEFEEAVTSCHEAGIEVVAHLILGLPGEGPREMLASAGLLARLGVRGVKLHLLHVVRDTELERRYYQGRVPLMGPRQYVEQVCDLLEILPPEMVIHRLQADCPKALLVAPAWINHKSSILNDIHHTLESRDSWQGKRFSA